FYVRSALDPEALGNRMRRIVQEADPGLPVTRMKTMRAQIRESLFVERMVASLSAAFGVLATLLAAVGLYGVMSYGVSLRTREIGIRVALGAERRAVLLMVLEEVAVMALIGVAIGLPSGYGLGRAERLAPCQKRRLQLGPRPPQGRLGRAHQLALADALDAQAARLRGGGQGVAEVLAVGGVDEGVRGEDGREAGQGARGGGQD